MSKRNPSTILTKKGWYYISIYRKHRDNDLWVGPFATEAEAIKNCDSNPKEQNEQAQS